MATSSSLLWAVDCASNAWRRLGLYASKLLDRNSARRLAMDVHQAVALNPIGQILSSVEQRFTATQYIFARIP